MKFRLIKIKIKPDRRHVSLKEDIHIIYLGLKEDIHIYTYRYTYIDNLSTVSKNGHSYE